MAIKKRRRLHSTVPSSKLKLIEDVEFIFSEALRFKELEREWLETKKAPEALKEGFLWEIPFPDDDKKKLPIGRTAMARLEGLAGLAARRAGIDRQIDVLTVRKPLAQALIRKFVLENRPIDVQHVERALSEAARKARDRLVTKTHFLPCHLMIAKQPTRFAIGPILFMRQSEFRSMVAERLWQKRSENRRHWLPIRDVSQYYRTFGWVACVAVPDCDDRTSETVARSAVMAALNCLHLFFGPQYTGRMSVGGPAISRDRRGAFTLHDDQLDFSATYGWPGEYGFQDDWTKFLEEPEGAILFPLFGIALEAAIDPRHERPLSDRFLDAAHWYGEAVRETSPAAKVIKYVTALERMLMTDEKDDITDIVSRRVAAFCFDPAVPSDFERWQRNAQRAYTLRSKLAHGSMSPRDPMVYEGVKLGGEVGRAALLSALSGIGPCGLRDEKIPKKKIADWFNGCTSHAEALRGSVEGGNA